MKIYFAKYHGTGNDFVLIDNREARIDLTAKEISFLCHRRFGIGADGLLILGKSRESDFSMRYFNADGGEGTMCGNGGRCIAAFARELGIIGDTGRFVAIDGEHSARILQQTENTWIVSLKMSDVNGINMHDGDFIVDTGSPHLVRFVSDISAVDVYDEGKRLRWDKAFSPGGINVNFAEIRDNGLIVRSFERGVEDITYSCGTGVTATALAASLIAQSNTTKFDIITDGGQLRVRFSRVDKHFSDIWLQGPAMKVFEGSIEI